MKRRIIAEKYMSDKGGFGLLDYKVFNFNGIPKLIQVDYDRFVNHKRNLYTPNWEFVDATIEYPNDPQSIIPKPKLLNEMLDLAHKLSIGIPFLRTDFYCIKDSVFFGELTIYHGSGFETIRPEDLEIEMGRWLRLPNESTITNHS